MVGMLDGRPPDGHMKRQDIKLEKDRSMARQAEQQAVSYSTLLAPEGTSSGSLASESVSQALRRGSFSLRVMAAASPCMPSYQGPTNQTSSLVIHCEASWLVSHRWCVLQGA